MTAQRFRIYRVLFYAQIHPDAISHARGFYCRTSPPDVAPPAYRLGLNPAPGSEQTQLRMESETVRMNIREETTSDVLGVVEVSALFTMKNLGSALSEFSLVDENYSKSSLSMAKHPFEKSTTYS